jgi:hypothetical protein
MINAELRQTQFNAVPLRNVVGVGNFTAYQVCVSRGNVIATPTAMEDFIKDSPANASRYDGNEPEPASVTRERSWFRRVLSR